MTEFDRMVTLLDQAWHLRDQIVPCLVGPVGIGKTAAVMQHAENVKANVVRIIASQILPSEVSGITMPDEKTESMKIYDHYRLSHLKDGDILFFDELLEADQTVLSACLTLIEDRMMMSGRKLPDIQIIAATNPTIIPGSLKENIRQRFMFMRFDLDKNQVRDFIRKDTGIRVPSEVLAKITSTGSEYNILSPRSLTKLCRWLAATPDDEVDITAHVIDEMWGSQIGTLLAKERKHMSPEDQVRRRAQEFMPTEDFSECTMAELLDKLQSSPGWERFKAALENEMIEEE